MSSLWKNFKICMCRSYDNWEINLTQWYTVFCFYFHSFTISMKSKVLFSAVLGLHVTDASYFSKMVPICFRLPCHHCALICFSTDFNKKISQKYQSFWAKCFGDTAKYFWFHNNSINLIKNTDEGNQFSSFLMIFI